MRPSLRIFPIFASCPSARKLLDGNFEYLPQAWDLKLGSQVDTEAGAWATNTVKAAPAVSSLCGKRSNDIRNQQLGLQGRFERRQEEPARRRLRQASAVDTRFLQLSLSNNANQCYQNTVYLSLYWLHAVAAFPLPQALLQISERALQSGRYDLMKDDTWLTFLSDWTQPRSLHDVREFLMHILQKISCEILHGAWTSWFRERLVDVTSLATAQSS